MAILSRWTPVLTRTELPGDPADRQSRYLEAAVHGVLVASIYAPNGNPQPGPKFDNKLDWLERLTAHAAVLLTTGRPLCWRATPTSCRRIWTSIRRNPGIATPCCSRKAAPLISASCRRGGPTPSGRSIPRSRCTRYPKEPMYTFWDAKRNRWESDTCLRLVHILISPALRERLQEIGVDRETRAKEGASDHAPVWAKLRDPTRSRTVPSRNAGTPAPPTLMSRLEAASRPPTKRPGGQACLERRVRRSRRS